MAKAARRSRFRGSRAVNEGERAWAYGVELPEGHPDIGLVDFFTSPVRLLEVWAGLRGEVVAAWIEKHPGSRPSRWWASDAPEEGRRRLGGTGTPCHEVLANVPDFVLGVPEAWISDWQVRYYNGRALNVDGEPIGSEFSEGDFPHDAIDPEDPPVFESQAVYLDRHGLLTDAERAELDARGWPDPEAVLPEESEV